MRSVIFVLMLMGFPIIGILYGVIDALKDDDNRSLIVQCLIDACFVGFEISGRDFAVSIHEMI